MKNHFFLFSLLTVFTSYSQNFHWAKSLCGSSFSEAIADVCSNSEGTIYLTGTYAGVVDFDPGPGVYNNSPNQSGAFVLALDSYGNFKWVSLFNGDVQPSSIKTDNSGNILVSGFFNGNGQFDPGVNVYSFSSTVKNAFVAKLSGLGNIIWVKKDGYNSQTSWSSELIVDEMNNIYNLGTYQGVLTLPTGSNMVSNGFYNTYLAKRDSNGDFLWAKSYGGPGLMSSSHLQKGTANELYFTGSYSNTVDFDPGPATVNQTSNGYRDIYVMKVDTSGDFIWAKTFGSSLEEMEFELAVDSQSNVYLATNVYDSLDIDPSPTLTHMVYNQGNADICLLKLSGSGNFIWSKTIASPSFEYVNGLTLNNQQDILMVGDFSGTLDFDPGSAIYNVTTGVSFLEKLDKDGNFIWVKTIDGIGLASFATVCSGDYNDLVVTGPFNSTFDFDTGSSIANLSSCGMEDVFILKFGEGLTGIRENKKQIPSKIYPNPSNGYYTVELEQTPLNYNMEIKDISGRILFLQEIDKENNNINLMNYPSGLYFATLKYNGQTKTVKVIKE